MRLVLFDVDGTLVDSQDIIVKAMTLMHERLGQPVPARAFMLDGVGLSLVPGMRRLFGDAAEEGLIAAAVDAYRDAFTELRADPANVEPLFPGAAEAVAVLARRPDLRLGIATGKSRRGALHIVERHGWGADLVTIQTADDAPSKPHPGMVLQGAEEAGVEPAMTVVVGDTTYDMEMARAAGAVGIGVAWGNHGSALLRAAGASLVIESFEALAAWLDETNGERAA